MAIRFLDEPSATPKSKIRFLDEEPIDSARYAKPEIVQKIQDVTKPDSLAKDLLTAGPSLPGLLNVAGKRALQTTIQKPESIPWQAASAATMVAAPAMAGWQGAAKLVGAAGIAGGAGKAGQQAVEGAPKSYPKALLEQGKEAEKQARLQAVGETAAPVISKGLGLIDRATGFVGRVGKAAFRSAVARYKGTGRQVIDTALENTSDKTETVSQALEPLYETAKKKGEEAKALVERAKKLRVGGMGTEEVSQKAVSVAQDMRNESLKAKDAAVSALNKEPTIDRETLLKPIDTALEATKVKGVEGAKAAADSLKSWRKFVEDITKDNTKISEVDLRQTINFIDDQTPWEGVADKKTVKALRDIRNEFRNVLRKNTAYETALGPSHDLQTKAKKLEEAFGLKVDRGVVVAPTLSTAGKTKAILTKGNPVATKAAEEAGMGEALKKGSLRISQGERKARVLAAVQAAGVKTPDEVSFRRMAETAIRQGRQSPAFEKLQNTLSAVMGEKKGSELAGKVVDSAAKEIFERSKGSALSGGSFMSMLGGARLGEMHLKELKSIDDWFQGVAAVSSVKRAGVSPNILTLGLRKATEKNAR